MVMLQKLVVILLLDLLLHRLLQLLHLLHLENKSRKIQIVQVSLQILTDIKKLLSTTIPPSSLQMLYPQKLLL